MLRARCGAIAVSLVLTLVFAAGAHAAITSSNITAPADGALLFQNDETNAAETYTVTGTITGNAGDLFDIACFRGTLRTNVYARVSGTGIALGSMDGSFTVSIPQSDFYQSGSWTQNSPRRSRSPHPPQAPRRRARR
jgi:hypothetical protein